MFDLFTTKVRAMLSRYMYIQGVSGGIVNTFVRANFKLQTGVSPHPLKIGHMLI